MSDILTRLAALKAEGKPVCLCVVTKTRGAVPRHAGTKMLVFPDGKFEGTVGGGGVEAAALQAALEALRDGKTRTVKYSLKEDADKSLGVCGGAMEVYIEPLLPADTLLIIGAGHVGRAVAKMAGPLGFRIVVSDEREGLLDPEVFKGCQMLHAKMAELPQKMDIGPRTFIVDVSHGSEVDVAGLPAVLATEAGYIGVIGSKKRWATTLTGLRNQGVSEEAIGKAKSPIGLAIEAETPEEIAISILAEVIAKKNTQSA
ncbi:MAG: XdhC/CoxI family protein [Anaerolineaceae bacterium]|nr:XdhC/CoxI family protein [Anaerolineaceae bacterium]